jgi:hypothetical protein
MLDMVDRRMDGWIGVKSGFRALVQKVIKKPNDN